MLKKILLLLIIIGCCITHNDAPVAKNQVQRVVDGDTVVLKDGTKCRLLGIDTPETKHPRKPVEKWGLEATAFTIHWIRKNNEVIVSNGDKGKYGRELVWIVSGKRVLNVELVRVGLAYFKTYGNHSLKYKGELREALKKAKADKVGIWSD